VADRRGRLAYLPLHAHEAETLLAPVPVEERYASWHLVLPRGRVASRGEGAPALLEQWPAGRRPARWLRRLPLERLYDAVARRRSVLGRLVPDVSGPHRFP
jgi:predicted DCC family thiol-disulfide oxidoreductase YuxK